MTPVDFETPIYTIGTAAKMLSVSVQTLRLYEREGLLLSFKTPGNQRMYSNADIDRIECIRRAISEDKVSVGGMKQIHGMVPCWDIIKCSQQERDDCPSFNSHTGGCWTFQHKHSVCAAKECRLCEVYKITGNCIEIKELIIRSTVPQRTDEHRPKTL